MNSDNSPLLIDAIAAAKLLGIGRSNFLNLQQNGRIGPQGYRLGRRVLYRRDEIECWIKAGLPPRRQWKWAQV